MKPKYWEEVNQIVLDALELDVSERQEFIAERCSDSPEIMREVESLLDRETKAENFFDSPAIVNYAGFLNADEEPIALAGQEIGNYRIIRELGGGGMGAVYLAERADGKFKQKVALKLLKREMNTHTLRRRFEQEREILASLEHPSIARLLDAGTTDDRIPFIAMEYVEGLPIDDYCNKHGLDLGKRLDLFREVCQAVNFAHRNLIVHRDLKPSNILVNEEGAPKLLDFGISKILSAEFEQADSATVTKLGVMTPSYASPEQLQNKSVTTATDIYSLGVILYELLSGHRPFEAKESNFKEVYKAVLEDEPERPSSVVSRPLKTGENVTSENNTQLTNPKSLSGDLDNIVLKALRKEPERRYSSAENLADDIHRHQRGLPVTARPNTLSYRAEKFIKRNKTGVIISTLLILAIIGGIIATLWQARIAAAERDRARIEAEKVKKINAYTQNILNFSNPHWLSSNPKRNRDATIDDALNEALKNIDTDLANEPEIQAEVLFTIGQTFVSQGQYEKSEKLLQQSIEKFDQSLGGGNLKSMQAYVIRGDALMMLGKLNEAEKLYKEAIKYFRSAVTEDKSQTKWLAIALNDVASIYLSNNNYAEAEELCRQSFELTAGLTGKDRFMVPIILGNLGTTRTYSGDFRGAIDFQNQSLEEFRLTGKQDSFDAGVVYAQIGINYAEIGDFEQAEINYQKSLDILMKTVGEENFYTAATMYQKAYNYYRKENYKESESLISESLKIQRGLFPNGHYLTANSERVQGEIFTRTGEVKKGEILLRKALDYLLKNFKNPNRKISHAQLALGENLIAQERYAEAEEYINSALDSSLKLIGENHPFTKQCREVSNKIPK